MHWFKHKTNAHADDKLKIVLSKYGLYGYGFYWRLLEIIGEQMNYSDKTSLVYPVKEWAKMFGTYPKHFKNICKCFTNLSLIFLKDIEIDGVDCLEIDCPNLLKIRDEYSKKKHRDNTIVSGQQAEFIPPKIQSTDTETDIEKESKEKEGTLTPEKIMASNPQLVDITNKKKYHEFVYLSDAEYDWLLKDYWKELVDRMIFELNNAIGSKNAFYPNHFYTVRTWCYRRVMEGEKRPHDNEQPKREYTTTSR